jgi:hypothetical protein
MIDEKADAIQVRIDHALRSIRLERDEARREVCERTAENLALLGSNARLATLREEHAARRGWDCYKEATQ